VTDGHVQVREYWDLDYPRSTELTYDRPEEFYVEKLKDLFARSVSYRLQADVPVGLYLSGGLDSSLMASMINVVSPQSRRHSFSIGFADKEICESPYQKLIANWIGSQHHETRFTWSEISEKLQAMIYHCECPVKETFNTCSMALSEAAKNAGISVVLGGEGADELFAGYIGYRFDRSNIRKVKNYDLETIQEDELRDKLWGDKDIFY
jgi:asparagine synthase (glutamine-hydrolysing)